MFTGIIENIGVVRSIQQYGDNLTFTIASNMAGELKVDQSISHNGVCLTVEKILPDVTFQVTAIAETLSKTNLSTWKIGDAINLERCLPANGRLDGHFVQGHVDSIAICCLIEEKQGSTEFTFNFNKQYAPLIIEKGSVCLNGVSLTLFDVKLDSFKVAIIPYTLQYTNLQFLKENSSVNIEFDILGKYLQRWRTVSPYLV